MLILLRKLDNTPNYSPKDWDYVQDTALKLVSTLNILWVKLLVLKTNIFVKFGMIGYQVFIFITKIKKMGA